MRSGPKRRFVPQIIFASTVAGAVPACAGTGSNERIIVLAVAGFSGCIERDGGRDAATAGGASGTANECGTGGLGPGNSGGTAGRANSGGATGLGGVIVLAMMGFSRSAGGSE